MVHAIKGNWEITLVDAANCFNPHLLSYIAFDKGLNSKHVLKKIDLSRPFQIYQSLSITDKLVDHILRKQKQQLIIMTDISSQYFSDTVANEDKDFPIPQLELFRQMLGKVESLALQGHIVLLNDTHIPSDPKSKGDKVVKQPS